MKHRVKVFMVSDYEPFWRVYSDLSEVVGKKIGCGFDFLGFCRWASEARVNLRRFGFGGADLLIFDQFGPPEWLSQASKALAWEFGIRARLLFSTWEIGECRRFAEESGEPILVKPFDIEALILMLVRVLSRDLGLEGLRVPKLPRGPSRFASPPVV